MSVHRGVFQIDDSQMQSNLDIPDGDDPNQNAWLTITIRYYLNFVDGYNDKAGVTVEKDGKYFALDSDKNIFPIIPWDGVSRTKFTNVFPGGEKIWNYRFVLITPRDYSGLDYESMAGPGWVVRPNVLCLFRLVPDNAKPHLRIDVVRLDPSIDSKAFRSHMTLYDDGDLFNTTFGHELGHALGLEHIMVMEGDPQCKITPDVGRCYGVTEGEKANIMGRGDSITLICAKPWLDRIDSHTSVAGYKPNWTATLDTSTPPRKLPLGIALVGMPTYF